MEQENRKRLWWLASYPKSGSTWVRMFVNAYITGFSPDINSAWQYVTGDLQANIYQLTAAQPVSEMSEIDSFYYRPAVLMNHILMSNTPDKTLKTHNARVTVDGIPLMPPKLSKGALYIVRDPRDVAVSFANHLDCTIDETIEKMNNQAMTLVKHDANLFHVLSSWSAHVDSWTVQNDEITCGAVKYEDLLNDPDNSWNGVLQALGIDVDTQRIHDALDKVKFSKLQEQEQNKGFIENGKGPSFFRKGQSGGWKETLSKEQVLLIEKNHHHTMQKFGYELCELQLDKLEN